MSIDMATGTYRQLLGMTQALTLDCGQGSSLAICPSLGGRVFAEVCDQSMHRIDLDAVASPSDAFNNYGGLNFWPAPEGGRFGFNYKGDEWYVQPAINNQPFDIVGPDSIEKRVVLTNRARTEIEAVMRRSVHVSPLPGVLASCNLRGWLSYSVHDVIGVKNRVSIDDALIGAWTLEQFDASRNTIAFCCAEEPRDAINFDYYEHPGKRITYFGKGFTYETDGRCRGRIGVRKDAGASLIGFYHRALALVCIRRIESSVDGLYFNIADNEQPNGPYSASDTYSIFNSGPDMGAFELETIGPMRARDGLVLGSDLVSNTTFAIFEEPEELNEFIEKEMLC